MPAPRFPWRYLPLLLCIGSVGCLCFSLEFGGKRDNLASGVLEQTGTIKLGDGQQRTVYYPVPYHNIPHLSLDSSWGFDVNHTTILSQERDHFVLCAQGRSVEVTWTARGLPITVALPPPQVVVTPPSVGPPTANPPAPLPPMTP
jgi:hypothetical protein